MLNKAFKVGSKANLLKNLKALVLTPRKIRHYTNQMPRKTERIQNRLNRLRGRGSPESPPESSLAVITHASRESSVVENDRHRLSMHRPEWGNSLRQFFKVPELTRLLRTGLYSPRYIEQQLHEVLDSLLSSISNGFSNFRL